MKLSTLNELALIRSISLAPEIIHGLIDQSLIRSLENALATDDIPTDLTQEINVADVALIRC